LKIGFDLQPLQTEQSKKRGIGRFTRNLLNSLLKNNKKHDFIFFSNDRYEESIEINLPQQTIKKINYISQNGEPKKKLPIT